MLHALIFMHLCVLNNLLSHRISKYLRDRRGTGLGRSIAPPVPLRPKGQMKLLSTQAVFHLFYV